MDKCAHSLKISYFTDYTHFILRKKAPYTPKSEVEILDSKQICMYIEVWNCDVSGQNWIVFSYSRIEING